MILQTLSFGYIYKNWLGGDPGRAIIFASILLFFAALAMMRTKVSTEGEEVGEVLMPAGH
jgi:maltose/moltooligosaccharide transporter